MSFAINPSLSFIDVPEESIEELYRSTAAIQLHDSGFRGHNCEAYICICKDDIEVRAYIALLETVMKTIFVYSSESLGKTTEDYNRVAGEAQEYVKKLGFTMERVNLDFSKAMREVIIKGIRVMRPPLKKLHGRQIPPATQLHAAKAELARQAEIVIDTLLEEEITAEVASLKAELSSARSAIEKVTRDKVALEAAAIREMAALKAAATSSAEALQAAAERHNAEIQALIDENNSLRTPSPDPEKEELKRAVAEAVTAQAELSDALEDLEQRLADTEANNRSLEQLLSSEAAAAKAEISRLQADNELLGANLSAEQAANSTALEQITALAPLETSLKESQQREVELCRDLDIMQTRVEELQAAVDAAEMARQSLLEQQELIANLEAELESNRIAAAALKAEEQMLVHTAAELKILAEAKLDVENEYIRLANDSREREEELIEALYAADEEILRLNREMEISDNVAAAEQEALRAELKQMIAAGAAAVDTTVAPAAAITPIEVVAAPAVTAAAVIAGDVTAGSAVPEPVQAAEQTTELSLPEKGVQGDVAEELFDDDLAAPLASNGELTAGLVNEFGSFCGSSGAAATEFTINPDMSCIEYSSPGEVVALLYSSNSVQAMPDGKKAERCKAFAVALKQSGSYSVYIVWHIAESRRTVICAPDHQPVDVADCTSMLQDAVTYFEIVGFMMEIEDLGETMGSRLKVLNKTSVLKRVNNHS